MDEVSFVRHNASIASLSSRCVFAVKARISRGGRASRDKQRRESESGRCLPCHD